MAYREQYEEEQCEPTSGCEIRRERHLGIDRAIDQLEDVYRRLGSFSERISGNETHWPNEEVPTPEPSLEQVLDSGAERIREFIAAAEEKISEIERKLF